LKGVRTVQLFEHRDQDRAHRCEYAKKVRCLLGGNPSREYVDQERVAARDPAARDRRTKPAAALKI
jgi:hypothetical protein